MVPPNKPKFPAEAYDAVKLKRFNDLGKNQDISALNEQKKCTQDNLVLNVSNETSIFSKSVVSKQNSNFELFSRGFKVKIVKKILSLSTNGKRKCLTDELSCLNISRCYW